MNLQESQTHINLLRAFAGESQARNRYDYAAGTAKNQSLHVIEAVFKFTAEQEKEHGKIFYNFLKEMTGENITIDGSYPVDIYDDVLKLLRSAQHNEFEEFEPVYPDFAAVANQEGFTNIGSKFNQIAKIEKTHGERFGLFADLLEQGKLFVSDVEEEWMCLNCGYVHKSSEAPKSCPVCSHPQGYFVRLTLAPFTGKLR
ncbi:rubrerythrin [Porcipelethomonas sp.]|uniref:rubrerythrin n=1 Tax=Porcipelethomonas sp. TaxID=2981675 RepID=UPI003EF2DC13